MNFSRTTVLFKIGGKEFNTSVYSLNELPNVQQEFDEDEIFGSDCVTSLATFDSSHVDEVLKRVSKDDMVDDCIQVVDLNGLYLIPCDLDSLCDPDQIQELLDMGLVAFGAVHDDIDAITCIDGYLHCRESGITAQESVEDEVERLDQCLMDSVDNDEITQLDELSSAVDFYSRAIEYNRDKPTVDKVLKHIQDMKLDFS